MSSGPIRMVIAVPDPIDFDGIGLVAVLADASVPSGQRLNDLDYFDSEVGNAGLVELLGIEEWEDLKPGLWLVEGYLWHEVDYWGEHDGGFEVTEANPFAQFDGVWDFDALVQDWISSDEKQLMVRLLARDLLGSSDEHRAQARQQLTELEATLSVLRNLVERQADRDEAPAPAIPLLCAEAPVSVQMPPMVTEDAATVPHADLSLSCELERPRCVSCGVQATGLVCESVPVVGLHPETGLWINTHVPDITRPYCAACAAARKDER